MTGGQLESLPPLISYSPLSIPLSSSRKNETLARRDLFDARFQLISEGRGDEPPSETSAAASALDFLDAPSDLVPGVYEGGLKTWECSLDLVDYLDGLEDSNSAYFSGKHILEASHIYPHRSTLLITPAGGVRHGHTLGARHPPLVLRGLPC